MSLSIYYGMGSCTISQANRQEYRMNRTQIYYLKERTQELYNSKVSSLHENLGMLSKRLTESCRLEYIRKGKAKRISWDKIDIYTSFIDAFETKEDARRKKIEETNNIRFKAALLKLESKKNTVLDQIILGDEQSALRLLEIFAQYDPLNHRSTK